MKSLQIEKIYMADIYNWFELRGSNEIIINLAVRMKYSKHLKRVLETSCINDST